MLCALVMAKVTVRGASGNDEVIEDQRGSTGKQDLLAWCIHLDDLGKKGRQIALATKQAPDGASMAGAASPAVAT